MENVFLSTEAKEIVEKSINDTVVSLDHEVVEVKYSKEYGKYNLTVYIWSKNGVDLNSCETIHNALSDSLDKYEELFPEEYVLNVSSSGLDRPIVSMDDFRRAMGTEIEVKQDKAKHHGILLSYTENDFVIRTTDKNPKEIKLTKENVKIQPYIRF
jgi:ribosome maturation factor RimP